MKMAYSKWYPEIQFLRGIAIIGVIIIHVTSYFTKIDQFSLLLSFLASADFFAHYAVPLFILISGFILYSRYPVVISPIKFYYKRFLSIIPAYICFSIIYTSIHSLYTFKTAPTFPEILYNILTGKAEGHLYFVIVISMIYLL